MHWRGYFVSDSTMQSKRHEIFEIHNRKSPSSHQVRLKFSQGWLWRFKQKNNFKFRKLHGEQSEADEAAYYRNLPILRNVISEFAQQDVWNCNEFALYYRMAPCYTIGPPPIHRKKKDKTRVTFLACTDSSGTEKFPLFVVSLSARPRCFVGRKPAQMGFIYGNSRKAWMNQCLFT